MLKRIKVRGKLLLLLATPLVAVMVFAASGVLDRQDATAFQEREARIAELANAGSDLSLAIQVERIRVLEVERFAMGSDDLVTEDRQNTNAQFERWLEAVAAVRSDIRDPELVTDLDDLTERLPTSLAPDRGSDMVTSTLLASASRAIDDTTIALRGEAADLELFRALTNLNELTNVQSAYAAITSVGADAIYQGQLNAVAAALIRDAERDAETNTALFKDTAARPYVEQLERLENADTIPSPSRGTADAIGETRDYVSDPSLGGGIAWLERGEEQLTSINALIDTLATDATASAQLAATTARDESRSFLVLAGTVALLAVVMAVMIGRSISRPLIRLTRSAEQLSAEELPALVESMRTAGRTEAPVLTPIEASGRDEVAQLAHAISEIQQVTIDVAEEQGDLLRRGISDIFVNLARRNQSLLDRQIDFIDQLEAREENPDQLENLFRLDHLATRMRRNAESLLVLAGAEPTRRRGRPVEIVDVLRVAMGEIEDFNRIRLGSVDGGTVAGSVAADLAHLMSELMENATQFSPPQVDVDVTGARRNDGGFVLTLADRGIGMSAEQIATANQTLAEPPLVGLDLSRSLGFTVVSRLAHRLGVGVELSSGSEGGVTATISIPAEMVGEPERGPGSVDDAPAATDAFAPPPAPDHQAEPAPQPPEPEVADAIFADREVAPDPLAGGEDGPPVPPAIPDLADLELSTNPFGASTPTVEEPSTPTVEEPPTTATGLPKRTRSAAPSEPEAPSGEPPAHLPSRRPAASTNGDAPTPPPLPTRRPTADPVTPEPAGDLFAAFGEPAEADGPAPSGTDIFSPLDAVGGSGPDAPVTHEPPAAPAAPAAEAPAPLQPTAAPAPDPGGALPRREPSEVGAIPDQVTSAGLIRRTPRKVDVPEESRYAPGGAALGTPAAADPTTPTPNRSPDEVRQKLSRYRAGLRKGRGPDAAGDRPDGRN